VEGPGNYTFYKGAATLDNAGRAAIEMPDWFDSLNEDVAIALTPWGESARDLHIVEQGANEFVIAGGGAGQRVTWIASGTRRDAWAAAHPFSVVTEKNADEAGYLAAPNELGYSDDYSLALHQSRQRESLMREEE
jgi:hypothetical protein